MSLSARRAWIEICVLVVQVLFDGSLSARRAWIEIAAAGALSRPRAVALRKESVDRNTLTVRNCSGADLVALRKESVDRNTLTVRNCSGADLVALRKESVDRNSVRES